MNESFKEEMNMQLRIPGPTPCPEDVLQGYHQYTCKDDKKGEAIEYYLLNTHHKTPFCENLN